MVDGNDVAQLALDLQHLINRARASLNSELAALDGLEQALVDRIEASQRFLDAFGHLAEDQVLPPPVPQQAREMQRTYRDLADELSRAMPQQGYR